MRRRTAAAWQKLVTDFAGSSMTVPVYCRRVWICRASFYRWRRLLARGAMASRATPVSSESTVQSAPFVDLGSLREMGARFIVRLDLGVGSVLQIVRG